ADRAVAALRRAFGIDPLHAPTLAALRATLRKERRFDELVEILQEVRERTPAPADRLAIEREIAELYELHLDDDEQAIAAFLRMLEIDPGHHPALDALERLYTATDRAVELLRVYDRKLALLEDQPKERARL